MTAVRNIAGSLAVVSIAVASLLSSSHASAQKPKTLLAVFAHPDDEMAIADVLAKYGRLGHRVQVLFATDGRSGTRVTQRPPGEELGRLRRDESRCAARLLGIDEPIFVGVERLDTQIGVRNYLNEHKRFLYALREEIPKVSPDFILTFGPDGDSAHSEHIVVSSAVTQVLLSEGWVERYPLYFVAWTKEHGTASNMGHVHQRYLNVKVEYTQADEDRGLEAMKCYVTQFTQEEMDQDRHEKIADRSNATYFRRFAVQKGIRDRF